MELKKKCDICGRLFKVSEYETLCEQYSRVDVRIQRVGYLIDQRGFNACEPCAMDILHYILDKKRKAPKKCEWCEHDFGPNHPDYHKGCEGCSSYSKFQLKKRMSDRQKYLWNLYNGEA